MGNAAQTRRVVLVLEDGSEPSGTVPILEAYEQAIGLPRYADGEVWFDFFASSRLAAPVPPGGGFLLTVRRYYYDEGDPPIAVEATIENSAGGELCGYFPIPLSLLAALEVAGYVWDVYYVDPGGKRWQVLPSSIFEVEQSPGAPNTPVTPGESQPPLGLATSSFWYTVETAAADFTITIPAAARFPAGRSYAVGVQLASDVPFAVFAAPIADRTDTTIRVLASGELPAGAVLEITLGAVVEE